MTKINMHTISLCDFFDSYDVESLFLQTTGGCMDLKQNTESEGDDFCDIEDVVYDGLSVNNLFGLYGTVDKYGDWHWDGRGNVHDYNMNSFVRFTVYSK